MTVFVRVALFPDATVEHYLAVVGALAGAPTPQDRLAFVAGPVPEGWQVVQIWTHRQALDDWNTAWFLPALARLGAGGFPRPPVVRDCTAADHDLRSYP